jgi:hypothetical protein
MGLYLFDLSLALSLHHHRRHMQLKHVIRRQLSGQNVPNRIEMPLCLRLKFDVPRKGFDAGVSNAKRRSPIQHVSSIGAGWPSFSGERTSRRVWPSRASSTRMTASQALPS